MRSARLRWVFVLATFITPAVYAAETTSAPSSRPSPATTQPAPIPYRVDHDAPLRATQTLVTDGKDFAKYRVEFNGIERDRVPAFLYVPKDGRGTHPAVLLQYGSGGNKSTNYIVILGEQFVRRGFVVLTIDVPGRGERRKRDKETTANRAAYLAAVFKRGTFLQTLGDYSRAVDYLSQRDDVDKGRIGYAGISLGAITGLTYVAHDPRIHAMASIVGGANFLGMLPIDWDPDVIEIAKRVDPFYHVALIAPRPLLLLNATHDQLVPRFFGEQLQKAAPASAKRVWIDTDHFFRGVDRVKVLDQVIDFMEDGLGVTRSGLVITPAKDPRGQR
jgi:dienelactone hydrolase